MWSIFCISWAFLLALCRKSMWSRRMTELPFRTTQWAQYPLSLSSCDVLFRSCGDISEYCPLGETYLGSVRSTTAILWRVHFHSSEVEVRGVSLCSGVSKCYMDTHPRVLCVCAVLSCLRGCQAVYDPVPRRSLLVRQRGAGDVSPNSCPPGMWIFDEDSNQRQISSKKVTEARSLQRRALQRRKGLHWAVIRGAEMCQR